MIYTVSSPDLSDYFSDAKYRRQIDPGSISLKDTLILEIHKLDFRYSAGLIFVYSKLCDIAWLLGRVRPHFRFGSEI